MNEKVTRLWSSVKSNMTVKTQNNDSPLKFKKLEDGNTIFGKAFNGTTGDTLTRSSDSTVVPPTTNSSGTEHGSLEESTNDYHEVKYYYDKATSNWVHDTKPKTDVPSGSNHISQNDAIAESAKYETIHASNSDSRNGSSRPEKDLSLMENNSKLQSFYKSAEQYFKSTGQEDALKLLEENKNSITMNDIGSVGGGKIAENGGIVLDDNLFTNDSNRQNRIKYSYEQNGSAVLISQISQMLEAKNNQTAGIASDNNTLKLNGLIAEENYLDYMHHGQSYKKDDELKAELSQRLGLVA